MGVCHGGVPWGVLTLGRIALYSASCCWAGWWVRGDVQWGTVTAEVQMVTHACTL